MFKRSLAFRLLCLSAAAATLPALVIAIVLRTISSRALQTSIQQNQMEIAQRVADEVNGEIHYAQGLMMFVARMPSVVAGNFIETQRALQNLMKSLPSAQEVMAVLDSGEERVKVTRSGAAGRLIKRNLNLRERTIGAPFFSGNRLPTVLITEPIKSIQGLPVSAALVMKMSFVSLGTLMEQTRVGQRGMAFVVDQRGSLLAHVDSERVRKHISMARTPVVRDWLAHPAEPTGLHEYTDDAGTPVIAMAYPIPLLQSAVVVQQPKADVYAPLKRMRGQFIAWTLLSVGVFLGLTVLIAWRIQQPLRQLQIAAEQIAQGKWDVKVNIQTGDELEELGKAFTRMADALRQLEVMRRDLISMIVHDLKSPLSSMLASMEFLLTNAIGPLNGDQRKFLTIGHRSGTDLMTLVQNLLDVAKLEEGRLILNKETFVPLAWAEEVLTTFRPLAAAGKKKLSLALSGDVPPIVGDRALLSRVLGNLVANALRHTPLTTGEVVVAVVPLKDQLSIEVRDNGQGIPQEYQTRIFEKFIQIERKRAHLRTGTGLGLTFCKMVVEAHGGRIFVNSVPDQGSTFIFLLPWTAPASVEPEAAENPAPTELVQSKA